MNKSIFSKDCVVKYISEQYEIKYKKKISPLKLQKTLYFLFGFWCVENEMNNKFNNATNNIEEKFLFTANFQAWKYGPVDVGVYKNQYTKSDDNFEYSTVEENRLAQEFIDEQITEIFSKSDFTLVNISHTHDCWLEKYDSKSAYHNELIDAADIKETFIKEYGI